MQFSYLYLQADTGNLDDTVLYALIAAVFLVVLFGVYRYMLRRQIANKIDPPYTKTVNDTNYNIDNEGISDRNLEDLSREEADEVIAKMKKSDYIPSDQEFRDLKKS